MKYLKDISLLLLYSFLIFFRFKPDAFYVLAFLVTLILCSLDTILDLDKFILPICLLYLVLGFIIPAFLYFFPPWAYIFIRRKCFAGVIVCTALFIFQSIARKPDMYILCIGLFGLLAAAMLSKNTTVFEQLEALYKQTRDDSAERNLLLAEKNRSLLEKQDYQIYTATLKERNRIAREIHDNVGHLLSRSILMVGALRLVSRESASKESLSTLEATLDSAMDCIRKSVHGLHDESIDLETAVKNLLKDFSFCPVSFHFDMGRNVPRDVKYSFISITKEALSNAIKHSSATHIDILMREHPALYQLSIEDNGTVPIHKKMEHLGCGIGLTNMEDRVNALNGHIQILTEKGFKIFITIPKEAE